MIKFTKKSKESLEISLFKLFWEDGKLQIRLIIDNLKNYFPEHTLHFIQLVVKRTEISKRLEKPIKTEGLEQTIILEQRKQFKKGTSIHLLPEKLSFKLLDSKGNFCQGEAFVEVRDFANPLLGSLKPRNSQYFNIALIGDTNTAKSSFANSISTLLSKSNRVEMCAQVGGTHKIERFKFKEANFNLFDVWGLGERTLQQYSNFEYEYFLDGKLPIGFTKDIDFDELEEKIQKECEETCKFRKIHGVIFFISLEDILNGKTRIFQKIIQEVKRIDNKILPLVLITKSDQFSGQFKEQEITSKLKSALKSTLDFYDLPIFWGRNYYYSDERKKSFSIDKNNFCIIYSLLKRLSSQF